MFTKALILVLLGSTLILAHPRAENVAVEAPKAEDSNSWQAKAAAWGQIISDKLKNAVNEIKSKTGEWAAVSQETIEKAKVKAVEVAKSTADAIEAEKAKLAQKIKEAKESEAVQTIVNKVKELEQQAEQAISNKIAEGQQTWEQWAQKTKEAATKEAEEKKKAETKA